MGVCDFEYRFCFYFEGEIFSVLFLGIFFVTPLTRGALLVVSIDRLWAIVAPFAYRTRNHNLFAIISLSCVYLLATCMAAISFYHFRQSDIIYRPCDLFHIFSNPYDILIPGTMFISIDIATYVVNVVIIVESFKARNSVLVAASARSETRKQVGHYLYRFLLPISYLQHKITRAIVANVFLHFVFSTAPMVVSVILQMFFRHSFQPGSLFTTTIHTYWETFVTYLHSPSTNIFLIQATFTKWLSSY
jgi:hypothetical protein